MIREAYRDLVNVWHPDRFSNNPRLKEKANEKLKEIAIAFEKLKSYIAGKHSQHQREKAMTNHSLPHEPPPPSEEKKQSKTKPEGIRTWLTTTTIGGMILLLLFVFVLITLNRQFPEQQIMLTPPYTIFFSSLKGTTNLNPTSL